MVRKRSANKSRNAWAFYSVIYSILHCSVFIPLILFTDIHPYLSWLASAGSAVFLIMGIDKFQSKAGKIRTPEILFYLLYLLGGFPGGIPGMLIFRHKTTKVSFKIVLALSLTAHMVIAAVLFAGSVL